MNRQISECACLVRLPVNVRCQIYKLVFGAKVIGITPAGSKGTKIRHFLCPAKGQKYYSFASTWGDEISWVYCPTHDREPVTRMVPILTCRQIYSESVNILWSHSVIYLQSANASGFTVLTALQAAILPRNFRAIRPPEFRFSMRRSGGSRNPSVRAGFTRWNSWCFCLG
ncbi:hypothetical protein BDW68DRAFT_181075 [Aspergillus falconensis]